MSSVLEESSSSSLPTGGCLTGRGEFFLASEILGVHLPVERDFIHLSGGGGGGLHSIGTVGEMVEVEGVEDKIEGGCGDGRSRRCRCKRLRVEA